MKDFIDQHNHWIENQESLIRKGQGPSQDDLNFHNKKISQLQHERLVHLLVMIFVGLALVIVFVSSLFLEIILLYVLDLILAILFLFYIRHYYLLENTVQKWYNFPD